MASRAWHTPGGAGTAAGGNSAGGAAGGAVAADWASKPRERWPADIRCGVVSEVGGGRCSGVVEAPVIPRPGARCMHACPCLD